MEHGTAQFFTEVVSFACNEPCADIVMYLPIEILDNTKSDRLFKKVAILQSCFKTQYLNKIFRLKQQILITYLRAGKNTKAERNKHRWLLMPMKSNIYCQREFLPKYQEKQSIKNVAACDCALGRRSCSGTGCSNLACFRWLSHLVVLGSWGNRHNF